MKNTLCFLQPYAKSDQATSSLGQQRHVALLDIGRLQWVFVKKYTIPKGFTLLSPTVHEAGERVKRQNVNTYRKE